MTKKQHPLCPTSWTTVEPCPVGGPDPTSRGVVKMPDSESLRRSMAAEHERQAALAKGNFPGSGVEKAPVSAASSGASVAGCHLRVCLSFVCLAVCPSVCLFDCLSVCPSVCLSVCLSVRLSVRPSVCPSVRLSVCLSACLPACLPACLSVCLPACLPVCLSASVSLYFQFLCNSAAINAAWKSS